MFMLEVLTRRPPYAELPEHNVVQAIRQGQLPDVTGVDPKFVAILKLCWSMDMAQRRLRSGCWRPSAQ
jgi:hypothetical protein